VRFVNGCCGHLDPDEPGSESGDSQALWAAQDDRGARSTLQGYALLGPAHSTVYSLCWNATRSEARDLVFHECNQRGHNQGRPFTSTASELRGELVAQGLATAGRDDDLKVTTAE
jgi:hypothetical protein